MASPNLTLYPDRYRCVYIVVALALALITAGGLFFGLRLQPSAGSNEISVGLIPNEAGLNDGGFNATCYQGLLRAERELGITGIVYTSTSAAEYETNLQQCADDGNALCIAVGFDTADAIQTVAPANPAVDFAIVDKELVSYTDNLRSMVFSSDQASYLAGTLVGLMSQSDVVGVVGGMEIPPVTVYAEPYRQGAHCSNPDVTVLVTYTNDFVDPLVGAQAAQVMMTQGADAIFGVGGLMGSGAVLTATQSGAWGIGVDIDFYHTVYLSGTVPGSDKLLTSVLKRMDNAVYATIADVISGTFTSGITVYDLAQDGVGLAPFHEADPFVPASVRGALERVERDIINGVIDPYGPCPSYLYLPGMVRGE